MTESEISVQKLADVKSDEKPVVVLLLAADADLVRIAVAWTNTAACSAEKFTRSPNEENANGWWNWL